MEHEIHVISGKVAIDHIHILISYRPNHDISKIVQWLKGISSRVLLQEFSHLRKKFRGRHFGACDCLAVSTCSIIDELIKTYIDEHKGKSARNDGQFDSS